MDLRFFMTRALQLAREALDEGELPVGAVAVLNGEIIGEGRRSPTHDSRLDHGEMLALRAVSAKCLKIPRDLVVFSTLEPCMQCAGALMNARASHVEYALEDPYGGACKFLQDNAQLLPIRHQEEVMTSTLGLMRDESLALFREYFSTTTNDYWTTHPENPLYKLVMS